MREPLADLQAWMQRMLLSGGAAASGRSAAAEEILERVEPSQSLAAAARLAIYQRSYAARLLQCMEGQFKALRHCLGADLFRQFAESYLREYPSCSPTLSELGSRFVRWLGENRPDRDAPEKEVWIDFMVELARYEWTVYLFFDKPGHEDSGAALATAEVADEQLAPQVSLELHSFSFPVADYYQGVADGRDPEVPFAAESNPVAIVRVNYRIGILRLTGPQYLFLSSFVEAKSVKEAIARTAAAFGKSEEDVARAWGRWKAPWCEAGLFGLRSPEWQR